MNRITDLKADAEGTKYECQSCLMDFTKKQYGKKWVYDSEVEPICRDCAEDIWTVKCPECEILFSNDNDAEKNWCPQCEEKVKAKKVTKKDIDGIFRLD